MKDKLLLQELCRKKRGWNGDIDAQEKQQWSRWLEDLSRLEEIKTEHCFKPKEFDELLRVESDIVRYVQSTSFPELTRILAETGSESRIKSAKKTLKKAGASLYKLNPKMNEGVLVVGGRLKNDSAQ